MALEQKETFFEVVCVAWALACLHTDELLYTLFGVVQPALHVPKSFSQQGLVIRRALDSTSVLTNTVTQLPFAAVTSQLLVRTSNSEGSRATVFPFRGDTIMSQTAAF